MTLVVRHRPLPNAYPYMTTPKSTPPQHASKPPLTHVQRVSVIQEAVRLHNELEAAFKPIETAFKTFDYPAWNVSWTIFSKYIELTEQKIGDDFSWLNWFIYDNDCGKKAFEAKASSWKVRRKIRTAKDLARLIEADLPSSK